MPQKLSYPEWQKSVVLLVNKEYQHQYGTVYMDQFDWEKWSVYYRRNFGPDRAITEDILSRWNDGIKQSLTNKIQA